MEKRTYSNKLQVILEFLNSKMTYKELAVKYGIPSSTIKSWVRAYRKRHPVEEGNIEPHHNLDAETSNKQLKELMLKNQLLNQIIKLAEEHTGIDFKKKFGTRQS